MSSGLFADAIAIPAYLEADQDRPFAERVARDRAIARSLTATDPVNRVRAWWSNVQAPGLAQTEVAVRLRRWIGLTVMVLGVTAGISVTAAVLHYDGSQPVNLVTVLALLLGVQWIMLVLAGIAVLPGLNRSRVLAAWLVPLNPAALVAGIWRRLVPAGPQSELFAWGAGQAASLRFARWQVVFWSQCGAVGFNVASLLVAVALLAFTDLAFGWSTTFAVGAPAVQAVTDALAAPWRGLLPMAVPSADLVEASRFFRLDRADPARQVPEMLTHWWPFLLMCMTLYGLLPRVLFCGFAAWRLRLATAALLLEDAGVSALLDRMDAPGIGGAPVARAGREVLSSPVMPTSRQPLTGGATGLVWSEALTPAEAAERAHQFLGAELTGAPLAAGGALSLAADAASVESLVGRSPSLVLVFVRAWEPPLLELLDLLRALRQRLPASTRVLVHPVPEDGEVADAGEVATWRRAVGTLGDAHIYVEAGARIAATPAGAAT